MPVGVVSLSASADFAVNAKDGVSAATGISVVHFVVFALNTKGIDLQTHNDRQSRCTVLLQSAASP